ncbi:NHL repeat-containing protein [Chitinimonas naiadis]
MRIKQQSSTSLLAALLAASLLLSACGDGGDSATPLPPVSLQLSASSADAFTGVTTPITLTAVGQAGNDTVSWTLSGAGGLSAATGATVQYTPPASIAIASTAVITATVRGLSAQFNMALHPYGPIALLAGNIGGPGNLDAATPLAARFLNAAAVGRDSAGNVYVFDRAMNAVRKIAIDGVVSTYATAVLDPVPFSTPSSSRYWPVSMVVDPSGVIFLADSANATVRRIDASRQSRILAGAVGDRRTVDGALADARFGEPGYLASDGAGGLYLIDSDRYLRRITAAGQVSTVTLQDTAGYQINSLHSLAWNGTALTVYATEQTGSTSIDALLAVQADGTVSARRPLPAPASLLGPYVDPDSGIAPAYTNGLGLQRGGLLVDTGGNAYLSATTVSSTNPLMPGGSYGYSYLLFVTASGRSSLMAGTPLQSDIRDGQGSSARFANPAGMAFDADGNLLVADYGTVRRVTPGGLVSTYAGSAALRTSIDGQGEAAAFKDIQSLAVDGGGNVWAAEPAAGGAVLLRKVAANGTVLSGARLTAYEQTVSAVPDGISVDVQGNVYAAVPQLQTIRKISPGGVVSTLAGAAGINGYADGNGANARFNRPVATAVDTSGNVYVADSLGYTVRKITSAGEVMTVAGKGGVQGVADGSGSTARFGILSALTLDKVGNIYVLDAADAAGNEQNIPQARAVRKITPAGVVTTLYQVANGNQLRFDSLAVDETGNVYLTSANDNVVRKLSTGGVLSVVAGDESDALLGTRLGALPGSLDRPSHITYLGNRRFAVSNHGGAVLLLTLP